MKTETFISLVDILKVRPEMYIGRRSVTALFYYLFGYYNAVCDIFDTRDFNIPSNQFRDWLCTKYSNKNVGAVDWLYLLLTATDGDEEMAFNLFWQEWDEFLSQRK